MKKNIIKETLICSFCGTDEREVDFLVEGENVYDLEDSDCQFQKETECVCPPGFSITSYTDICKLTPNVDCSIKEPGCIYTPTTGPGGESCKKPTFINEAAEKAYKEVLENWRDNSDAFFGLAATLRVVERYPEAISFYEQAFSSKILEP